MSPAKEIRQSTVPQLRAVNKAERTVDVVASTADLDSYGTRIDQSGWDLSQFKKNPAICLQHDACGYSGTNGLPVANAIPETVRIEGGQLRMTLRFPQEGKFPLADVVFNLVADGFLRGISVGFDPMEWEDTEEDDGKGYKKKVRIFKRQKLVEVSVVTIPANDNALVQRAKELNREEDVEKIKSMAADVERMAEEKAHELVDRKLGEVTIQVRASDADAFDSLAKHLEKCRDYFDKKQPANREATKVLEKFYKRVLKEEPPEKEEDAWKRMGDAVEAMDEKDESDEHKPDEKAAEEPEKPPTAELPAEAPQGARKASVHIPLDALPSLFRSIRETCVQASVEASRKGVPASELGGVIDAAGSQIQSAFLNSPTFQ